MHINSFKTVRFLYRSFVYLCYLDSFIQRWDRQKKVDTTINDSEHSRVSTHTTSVRMHVWHQCYALCKVSWLVTIGNYHLQCHHERLEQSKCNAATYILKTDINFYTLSCVLMYRRVIYIEYKLRDTKWMNGKPLDRKE